MSMRLFIGGVRGSRPCTSGAFEEFGGDTTSLLVLGPRGQRLILDAGTGMHTVAGQLKAMEPGLVTVFFSHYHLDHMVGLTANSLFYQADWSFELMGPTFDDGGVREAVTQLVRRPYWPIAWDQMSARMTFAELPDDEIRIGTLRVRHCVIPHPGGCVAYRIDDIEDGASLVYATDMEWRDRSQAQEAAFSSLCREPKPADCLLIDAHFAGSDAEAFAGWGHTSWHDGVQLAEDLGIGRLLLGHHDPEADDVTLRRREQEVKNRAPNASLARAGQWITIEG